MSALRQTLLKSVVQNKSQQPKQKQSLGRPPKDPMRHPHHQTELQERAEPPFVPDPSSWERDSDATLQFSFPDRPPRPSEPPQSQQQQLRGTKVSFMSDHSTIPSPVYNRSQRSSTITGNTMATDDSFDGDVDPGQAAIFHQIGMQKSTGDAPPYAEPDEKVLTTSSRPGPTPVQPSLRPPMQTHPEIPSSRKLRQELYDALVLKNKRIQLARRRIRLMEGLALVSLFMH